MIWSDGMRPKMKHCRSGHEWLNAPEIAEEKFLKGKDIIITAMKV